MDYELSIYDAMMEYFEGLGIFKCADYLPYYIASIGCHIANMRNAHCTAFPNTMTFFKNAGTDPGALRLNLLFVAPPNSGKSLYMKLFGHWLNGLLRETKFEATTHGYMTESALVGTFPNNPSKKNPGYYLKGLAEKKPTNILMYDEFANSLNDSVEGKKLSNQLLTVGESGRVVKELSAGEIRFNTWVTLWANTQPARLDLRNGLDRRFLIFSYNPSEEDRLHLLKLTRRNYDVAPKRGVIKRLRDRIDHLFENFVPKKVVWEPAYERWLDSLAVRYKHFRAAEVTVIDRFAIGYNAMRAYIPGDDVLEVRLFDDFVELAEASIKMRLAQVLNSEAEAVLSMLTKEWTKKSSLIRHKMSALGMSYKQSIELLNWMGENGLIEEQSMGNGKKSGRKVQMVKRWDNYDLPPPLDKDAFRFDIRNGRMPNQDLWA